MSRTFRDFEREERLGGGDGTFRAVRDCILGWGLQLGAGIGVTEAPPQVAVGATAVLRLRMGAVRFRAPVRVIEVVDTAECAGFSYETLPGHPEDGVERFLVTNGPDGVRLRIAARSRPGRWFTRLGEPLARRLQDRFTERYIDAATAAAANRVEG